MKIRKSFVAAPVLSMLIGLMSRNSKKGDYKQLYTGIITTEC